MHQPRYRASLLGSLADTERVADVSTQAERRALWGAVLRKTPVATHPYTQDVIDAVMRECYRRIRQRVARGEVSVLWDISASEALHRRRAPRPTQQRAAA